MLGALFEELLYEVVPDHPLLVYVLPTLALAGGLAATADPFPALALAAGVALSVALSLAYEHTGIQQESTGGDRSTADWVVVSVFVLVVGGIVIVGEVDAIDPGVSSVQLLGVVTGLLAGASVVEWMLPALRKRIADR